METRFIRSFVRHSLFIFTIRYTLLKFLEAMSENQEDNDGPTLRYVQCMALKPSVFMKICSPIEFQVELGIPNETEFHGIPFGIPITKIHSKPLLAGIDILKVYRSRRIQNASCSFSYWCCNPFMYRTQWSSFLDKQQSSTFWVVEAAAHLI